eukprot:GILK01000251.1.p1 GENE.GILK01000251.1~~GILK01000251.1.p1  ORF type:complete len:489 (+),score=37.62 GILK01000251.1:95-1561(+)
MSREFSALDFGRIDAGAPPMFRLDEVYPCQITLLVFTFIVVCIMIASLTKYKTASFQQRSGGFWLFNGLGLCGVLVSFQTIVQPWPNIPPLWAWLMYFLMGYPLIYIPTIVRCWRLYCILEPTLEFPYVKRGEKYPLELRWSKPFAGAKRTERGFWWSFPRCFVLHLPFSVSAIILGTKYNPNAPIPDIYAVLLETNNNWDGGQWMLMVTLMVMCGLMCWEFNKMLIGSRAGKISERTKQLITVLINQKELMVYTVITCSYSVCNATVWNILIMRQSRLELALLHTWLTIAHMVLLVAVYAWNTFFIIKYPNEAARASRSSRMTTLNNTTSKHDGFAPRTVSGNRSVSVSMAKRNSQPYNVSNPNALPTIRGSINSAPDSDQNNNTVLSVTCVSVEVQVETAEMPRTYSVGVQCQFDPNTPRPEEAPPAYSDIRPETVPLPPTPRVPEYGVAATPRPETVPLPFTPRVPDYQVLPTPRRTPLPATPRV